MSSDARTTGLPSASRSPGGWIWVPLLLLDLVLLLKLRSAPLLLGGCIGLAGLTWLLRRGERAVAFAAAGLPLIDPLLLEVGSETPAFVLGRLLLIVPLLLVGLGAFWALAEPGTRERGGLWREPIVAISVALALVLAGGLAYTPSPEYGRGKVLGYVLVNLNLLLATAIVIGRRGHDAADLARRFATAMLVCELLIAVAGVHNYFTSYYPWKFRLVSLGMNPIWVGRHAGQGLLILFLMRAQGWIPRWQAVAGTLLLGFVFWVSGSRGVLVALLAALAGHWVLLGGRRRALVAIPAILGVAAAVLVLTVTVGVNSDSNPFLGRGASNLARAQLIATALRSVGEVGLLGVGTGGFSGLARVGDLRYYPHNILIEIGLENGLPGLLLLIGFLFAVIAAWRRARRFPEQVPIARLAFALWLFHLANAQASGDVGANDGIWLWAGVLLALSRAR